MLLQSLIFWFNLRKAVPSLEVKTWQFSAEFSLAINIPSSNCRPKSKLNQAPGCGQSAAELNAYHISKFPKVQFRSEVGNCLTVEIPHSVFLLSWLKVTSVKASSKGSWSFIWESVLYSYLPMVITNQSC